MRPVFKQPSPIVRRHTPPIEQQTVQVPHIIVAQPAPQCDILAPIHHLERINLHPADSLHCRIHLLDPRLPSPSVSSRQPLRMQRQSANCLQRIQSIARTQDNDPSTRMYPFYPRRAPVFHASPFSYMYNPKHTSNRSFSMKVTDFKTMVVNNEPPYIGGRYLLFLELHTDEGITGLGERITGGAYSQNLADLKTQIGLIEEMVRNFVIGEKSPQHREDMGQDVRLPPRLPTSKPLRHARHKRDRPWALWDIAGKGRQSAHLQPARRQVPRDAPRLCLYAWRRVPGESRSRRRGCGAAA